MRTAKSLFRESGFFLIPYSAFLLAAGTVLSLYSRREIHLFVNRHYSAAGDLLMPMFTWLGDGYSITVLVLLLFALNRRFAFFTGIACLGASGVTQLLKHTLFYGDPRPMLVFKPGELRLVPGIENDFFNTFPSGHSTVAFAFFFSLSLAFRNKWLKLLMFLFAATIAYSRIYLSQHFLGDVFAGSLIGTSVSFLLFTFASGKKHVEIPIIPKKNGE
ncbi:MAG TPA: phosphatase PAP2 family protein [Bacteroidia bacterium]|nr:phosphatase PAP2 family protein [Bacteroidia bacterium]